jgi:hypothetical protein
MQPSRQFPELETSCLSLKAPIGSALAVELVLDAHVHLHHAQLIQHVRTNGRVVFQAYKDERSAVWRHVTPALSEEAVLTVSWLAIANAAPGASYSVVVSIRDSHGRLVDGTATGNNPCRLPREIGPASDPTDLGRLDIIVM